MNRDQFLSELAAALRGLPPDEVGEILADYRAHFDEGGAAGRSEREVAAALGHPKQLARELRAEAGLRRWEQRRTPANLVAAFLALCGLAAVDVIVLVPLIFVFGLVVFVVGVVLLALIVAGLSMLASPLWVETLESWNQAAAVVLAGIGLVAGGIGFGAVLLLVMEVALKVLSRYARLHYQVIRPADEAAV
jgi:uncharacterized membrane protein